MNTINQIGLTLALVAGTAFGAAAQADSLVNTGFELIPQEDVVTAIQSVDLARLQEKSNSQSALGSELETMVGGYNGNIWGQNPLVLVDGMPREASDIQASEVQTVTFLKDAAAVAIYGSRGAKGVILITTKRGSNQPMRIDFRGNVGFDVPKSYPNYLDAQSYMTLYNEACVNDGLAPRYSDYDIYNTATGNNPYEFPNQKYYNSNYLRRFSNTYSATGEITGGNERTHYYLNMGLKYNNGLIKVGEHDKDKTLRFNVRGNVDMTITKWLKGFTNASLLVDDEWTARGDLWGMASGTWPNRFGVLIPVDMIDPNNAELQ